MEIEQLQKSNYVHIQLAGALEICQVVGVHDQVTVASINHPFENLHFDIADIKPIPLTEFWLKEFSFEETGTPATNSGKTFARNGVVVTCEKTQDNKHHIEVKQEGQESTISINFVHELQNYFAAVNEEEISLP